MIENQNYFSKQEANIAWLISWQLQERLACLSERIDSKGCWIDTLIDSYVIKTF